MGYDNIIFGSTNESLCREFVSLMQGEFEMSLMGELTYFLGFQIKQGEEGNFISQTNYCLDLLKKFEMKDSKTISTPIASNVLIDKDERGLNFDGTRYRGKTRSLLYLITSRSDIIFSLCTCARYQASPKDSHFKIVKHILRYLNGTSNHGLWYPKGSACSLVLIPISRGASRIGRVLVVHATYLEAA